ncbi:transglycosylase domain-containing protein [Sphingomonas sp.]|uniref:transglycosylase domain-containing protein n=1 Tax=Sphingomonas sp. TaxID=28214 RepID=UPI003FA68411
MSMRDGGVLPEPEATVSDEPRAAPPPPTAPTIGDQPRRLKPVLALVAGLFIALFVWLALTAPLSKSLQPIAAPSITLLSAEGEPIARRGAIVAAPVDVTKLPNHVPGAFLAIEDRRFYTHIGVDPWGIARAAWRNTRSGGVREGGSTITQQLAKLSFLSADRTAARKVREALIAFWLEIWLSKEEILSRYLSSVYFGDNVYGLRAAAHHYFTKKPEDLTVPQAAMLAGLVKAPSRLAPTSNLTGARRRAKLVVAAMVEAGMVSEKEAARLKPAKLRVARVRDIPTGTYFADWVLPEARSFAEATYGEREVTTTLENTLQRQAVRAVRNAGLGRAQVALIAMRRDGRIVAMVGGKDYAKSPFNRATQARRQPGSTFKLFVYLAALRAGMTPDTMISDTPLTVGDWSPKNHNGRYRGLITLREAFATSSNVAAVRLSERVGRDAVIRAARDLGVTSPLTAQPSLALGTSGMTLLELTSAYAAVAANSYPIKPRGLPEVRQGWFQRFWGNRRSFDDGTGEMMLDLLAAAANDGTGRAAALRAGTFGKTGTTQDNRDAIFVGFSGDIVTAVWVGNDDNSPLHGVAGGGIPARIWRDFMAAAVKSEPARPRQPIVAPPIVPDEEPFDSGLVLEDEPVAGGDEFTVELSRPIEGPDDEVDAVIVPDIAPPPPVEELPDSGE